MLTWVVLSACSVQTRGLGDREDGADQPDRDASGGALDAGELDARGPMPPADAGTPRDAGPRGDGYVPPPDGCVAAGESCNARDDDCDGLIDDGLSRPCTSVCGPGTEICHAGTWSCDAPVPGAEACNGLDDDCDGVVDTINQSCTTTCGTPGTRSCTDGTWKPCTSSSTEVCNGLDDDCDGVRDEEGCPCPVIANGGSVYQLCTTARTWTSAQSACRSSPGWDLVSIESASEDGWVWSQAASRSDTDWWIGLHDSVWEGRFQWSSGSSGSHRNWMSGEPNDYGGQDCVRIGDGRDAYGGYEDRGRWGDEECSDSSYTRPYVCEAL